MEENILWLEFGVFSLPVQCWWCIGVIGQDESDQNWLNFPSSVGLTDWIWLGLPACWLDWLNNKKQLSLPRLLTPWCLSSSSWLSMTAPDTMPVVILRSLRSDCFIIPLHLASNNECNTTLMFFAHHWDSKASNTHVEKETQLKHSFFYLMVIRELRKYVSKWGAGLHSLFPPLSLSGNSDVFDVWYVCLIMTGDVTTMFHYTSWHPHQHPHVTRDTWHVFRNFLSTKTFTPIHRVKPFWAKPGLKCNFRIE